MAPQPFLKLLTKPSIMIKFFRLFLILVLPLPMLANTVEGQRDPLEIRLYTKANSGRDMTVQARLREMPAWQNFLQANGTWYVQFDERSATPHRAFGKPIITQGATPAQRADWFVQNKLNGFGSNRASLVLANENATDKFHYIHFKQLIDGVEVLFSGAYVKMTPQGKVVTFGIDVHPNPTVAFQLAENEAVNVAKAQLPLVVERVETWGKAWLPVPRPGQYELRPVHRVVLAGKLDSGLPFKYLNLVDAIDGAVLMRKSLIDHAHGPVPEPPMPLPGGPSIQVNATVYANGFLNGTSEVGLPNLRIQQGSTFYTDADGFATATAGSASLSLQGLWSRVYTNGTTPSATTTVPSGPHTFSFDQNANVRENTAYYHVNRIHDHMKTFYPSFTMMDNALPTNIDLTTDNCNAFYDGSSINFYASANNCQSFALFHDVIYHEYGHGINDKYYQSQGGFFANGAMGEGYADIWALGLTQNPVMSLGYQINDATSYIRRYDIDPKVYPEDLIGEVHADGEIIAGAWWDLHLNFGSMQQMLDMYAESFNALVTGADGNEGQVYVDILIEALTIDDSPANGGDNDITNGTPRVLDIINAFDAHGITLLSNATLAHNPITSASNGANIQISASVTLQYAWALSDAICRYRLNNGTQWQTLPLVNQGGNNYSASIPAQQSGTVVGYYVALRNLNGTLASVNPIGAHNPDPNLPHFILVGYALNRTEDFDNFQSAGWQETLPSDNNSTGDWIIDVPMGSYTTDGVMVQVDYQNTPGGVACAVTGNASSTSAGIGENDVDAGHTTIVTPIYDLSGFDNPAFTYARYYTNSPPTGANPGADWWQVLITNNGTNWVYVENTKTSDMNWRRNAFRVKDHVELTSTIRIKFIASDSTRAGQYLDGGSLVEAAVDDVLLYELGPDAINEASVHHLSIYPNPSAGQFTLSGNTEGSVTITISDALGRVIKTSVTGGTGNLREVINLEGLSPGVYQLSVSDRKGHSARTIVHTAGQ